jgi:hypothetical protein
VNWSTNGRSILPMVVPVGILIARRMEERATSPRGQPWRSFVAPLSMAAALSVAVAWADTAFANTARSGAASIHARLSDPARTIWFQGHWGFQYYMEKLGAKPLDQKNGSLAMDATRTPWSLVPGDVVVIPVTNTNFFSIPKEWVTMREVIDLPSSGWLSTMHSQVGASFYSDVKGPLPFAFGAVSPEQFLILDVRPHRGDK